MADVEVPEVASSDAIFADDSNASQVEEPVVDEEEVTESATEPSAPVREEVVETPAPEPASPAKTSAVEELVPSPPSPAKPAVEASPESPSDLLTPSSSSCCAGSCPFLHPQVRDLMYWRNPVYSGVTLGVGASLLILLRSATVLSVVSLWLLCMLIVAVSFRVVVATVLTFQKKDLRNPLDRYRHGGFPLDQEKLVTMVTLAINQTSSRLNRVRSALLVEDVGTSMMMFLNVLGLYQLTCWLSPLSILTVAYLAMFIIPPVYEKNKVQIDPVLKQIGAQCTTVLAQVRALPVIGQLLPKEKTA